MRAAMFEAPGQPLLIGNVEAPKPHPTDLVVRVRNCGICVSDLHLPALPYLACGQCLDCLSGRGHRCRDVVYTGMGGPSSGSYADYVRVGGAEAMALRDGVDYQTGALVEHLAVALHAVRLAHLRPGDSVLIIGAGPIGLAVALWCRFFGARHVVISDLAPGRLAKAAALGATEGIDASTENVAGRYKQIAGRRAEVVFDCVGVAGS